MTVYSPRCYPLSKRHNLKSFLKLTDDAADEPNTKPSQDIEIDRIVLAERQPRRYFDPDRLNDLAHSIEAHGILEPLLVRPLDDDRLELIAGERRYRAARLLNLSAVPVIIRELSDRDAWSVALAENLQREDLNPIDETEAILQLLELQLDTPVEEIKRLLYRLHNQHKRSPDTSTHNVIGHNALPQIEALFEQLGQHWTSFVANRLPLLNLPEDLLNTLREGKLSYTKVMALSRVKNVELRQHLIDQALQNSWSVAEIRKQVKALDIPAGEVLPKDRLESSYRRLRQAQPWNDPKRWRKVQSLLDRLDRLLEDDPSGSS